MEGFISSANQKVENTISMFGEYHDIGLRFAGAIIDEDEERYRL